MEKLTQKERKAQEAYLEKIRITRRKTKKPIIVAMVGLVGSGRSSIAKEFARLIGGTVVEGDEIRVELRKQRERYEGAKKIAENTAEKIIKNDGNVVFGSDFIDPKKRARVVAEAKKLGSRLVYIRTHCDMDVVIGRIIAADYKNKPEDFFGGASSAWKGNVKIKGAVVKIREMWRRTPHHYEWKNEVGGKWVLKKLAFPIFAEIDTIDGIAWKKAVQKIAKKLLVK